MTVQAICAIITCAIAVAGILVYIGRSLQILNTINTNQKFLFEKTDKHDDAITRIDKELVQVKTRQEDCENCP